MDLLPGPHKDLFSCFHQVCAFIREEVDKHYADWDPSSPRDFIDCYLTEIQKVLLFSITAEDKIFEEDMTFLKAYHIFLNKHSIFGKHTVIFHLVYLSCLPCVGYNVSLLYRGKMIWKQDFMKRVCNMLYLICLWLELRPHLPLYCGPLYT